MDIYQQVKVYSDGRSGVNLDRLGYFAGICCDRQVLHVGCCDAPLSAERLEAEQLLQQRIAKTATEVVGIDIDQDSIQFLQDHGIPSIQVMDAEDMKFDRKFHVILAGDVLEHLSNPGLFLRKVPDLLDSNGELVIAVPNAFTFLATRAWLLNKENVHKDHCFYFTPKCLAQLCGRYGLFPTKLLYTVQPPQCCESKLYIALRSFLVRFFPAMAPAFVMHFQKECDVDQDRYYLLR